MRFGWPVSSHPNPLHPVGEGQEVLFDLVLFVGHCNCQNHNLWRHAKADGQDTGADTGRYKHVMAIFEYVAGGVPRAEI